MCSEKARTLLGLGLGLALAACGGAAQHPATEVDLSPSSLYPLSLGRAWSYDVDTGDGQSVLVVNRVTAAEGGVFELHNGTAEALRYRVLADGITHADKDGYLLKAPIAQGATWRSGPHSEAVVLRLHERVTGTAGEHSECVVVAERNADTGQRIETTYCPGVGPALVAAEMEVRGEVVRVTAKLRGFGLGAD
jgi:hypothetical protein